ncbi:MAG: class I adenylate-forming enzyme family protein [Pseudomonadota bacterium]
MSELAQARIQATTLADLLLTAADQYPDTDAVVLPYRRKTYAEVRDGAMRRARSLRALGVGPGDHVGILLPTSIDFVESLFAISMVGAVAVSVNARYKPMELAYVVENADLVALLTTDKIAEAVNFVERLRDAFPDLGKPQDALDLRLMNAPKLRSIVLYGTSDQPGFIAQDRFDGLHEQVDEDEVHLRRLQTLVGSYALMLYTSGTTANPKGCLLTHEAIVRNSIALADRYELTAEDSFWSPLPMFHIAAILPLVAIFAKGGTYATMLHFDGGEALKMIEAERVTATYPCFWAIMGDLINHPNFASTDLSSIKMMNANFAVQPPAVAERMEAAMPNTIYVGTFGMTETAGTVTTSRLNDTREQRFERLGVPLPGLEIKAVDPDSGDEVPTGEKGEALIRGYSVFTKYYKSPEKSREALADGWFHSGDLVSIDADGQVMFHGRIKDMLKVGGENVAAAEIEACLQQHPAVKLAQVVAAPDPRLQEVAAAFIELQDGESADPNALIDFCKARIAGFKVPRYVRFIDEWPTSSTKIQKFKLKDQIEAELAQEAAS